MVPHTRHSGSSLPLRNPSQIMCRQDPERNMGVHAATQHFNPNPYNDESSTVPHPLRVYYNAKRAAPAGLLALLMVLSPSAKPDLENAQTMHHEIQECVAILGFLTPQTPIQRICGQGPGEIQVLSPSAKPNPGNAQTMHHKTQEYFSHSAKPLSKESTGKGPGEIQACAQPPKTLTLDYSQPIQRGGLKYGATHLPKRVLSPSAQPHLKNATQDPNPEYQ
ncbi:hypothetical protein BS47DRAFT_1365592 [Hydnum rufescens UP504]|uniref:Uncharacterized protein n=1 Tax=Hydnum rufescens UP504 TaxID=1448309 RepID=A0A9P6DSV1_9AGAM|nr:hypothetical protein BS47DRAFT_1365592 [Hydnum rufescens UP504]